MNYHFQFNLRTKVKMFNFKIYYYDDFDWNYIDFLRYWCLYDKQ